MQETASAKAASAQEPAQPTPAEAPEPLAQLNALLAAGILDDKAYAQGRARLAGNKGARSGPRWPVDPLLIGALLAGVAVVGMGYGWMAYSTEPPGAPPRPHAAAPQPGAPHTMDTEQVRAMVAGLEQRLGAHPDDAEGWRMLARSWSVLGDPQKSVASYRRAAALAPGDAGLLADFADTLAVTQGHRIDGEALTLVEQALRIDPDQIKALSLAGTAAFDQGDFAAAARHWGHLQTVGPADHPLVRQMAAGLDEARRRAGQSTVAEGSAASRPAPVSINRAATVAGSGPVALGRDDLLLEIRDPVRP